MLIARRSALQQPWARLLVGGCAAMIASSCGTNHDAPGGLDDGIGHTGPGSDGGGGPTTSCATPQEGCACETDGEKIDCGQVDRRSGDYVSCSLGSRTCVDNHWGACSADRIAPPFDSTRKPLAFGRSAQCVNNPCDPYCVNYVDNATGLDAGDPLACGRRGVHAAGPPRGHDERVHRDPDRGQPADNHGHRFLAIHGVFEWAVDLGNFPDAQPNLGCTRLYCSATFAAGDDTAVADAR